MDHLQYILLHCNTWYIVLPTKYYTSVSYEESSSTLLCSSFLPLLLFSVVGRRLLLLFFFLFHRARINTVFRNYADTNIQYY